VSRPVLHLRRRPAARITEWIARLDECEPGTPEALEIYQEAAAAGLTRELSDALQADAARCRNEAAALAAELQARK
jgi:hypothetical protein